MSKKEAAEKYFKLGKQKYNKKDYQGAIADLNKAIELNPKDARAYYNRGVVKDELKQYKEAIADYTEAIKLNPKYSYAYNNRGVVKGKLKQHKEAIADFDKDIELNPEYAQAYYNRGLAYRELGQKEKADTDSRTWAKLIGERTKEIKEKSETVKSKIEAVEEKTENIAKQTEETQAFQKTLEDLKDTISKDEKKWGKISVVIVLITSLIFIGVSIIYIFFSEEAKSFFLAYFIFPFFSIVSFTVLRIYTSIKKHRLEAENRLAMAKMLAHIENPDNKLIAKEYYQKQFLPELAKVIITPLYPDKNQKTDGTNLAEMIKNLLKK